MTDPATLNEDAATRVAASLRRLHAELADRPEDVRRGYLREQLDRAAADVHPTERRAFLERVRRLFPTPGDLAPAAPPPSDEAPPSGLELASMLSRAWSSMSDREREIASEQLAEAGVSGAGPAGGSSGEALAPSEGERLRQALLLSPEDAIDSDRLAALAASLIDDFAVPLDQRFWTIWQRLSPHGEVPRVNLQRLLGDVFRGDEGRIADAEEELKRVQRLIVVLLFSVGRCGRVFWQEFAKVFSPDAIRMAVGPKGKKDAVCWLRYTEMMEDPESLDLEGKLMRALAREVEGLLRANQAGTGAPGD